jgi:hypothetical protein
MTDRQIMISMWAGLFCLVPILVLVLYHERSDLSKQCADANGTLIMTKSDNYICIKTKAIIPLNK